MHVQANPFRRKLVTRCRTVCDTVSAMFAPSPVNASAVSVPPLELNAQINATRLRVAAMKAAITLQYLVHSAISAEAPDFYDQKGRLRTKQASSFAEQLRNFKNANHLLHLEPK
eukprot:TRINITY_DN25343_c0_g1_i1.p2 TRINITY_DN25343_c0_g1~~TRINITY_DN25343_c0_g1_i1.p2  ORF type:complete len:114 (-),score=13.88 TRINITY_DN25343_c0_g1_i1:6-347(-)